MLLLIKVKLQSMGVFIYPPLIVSTISKKAYICFLDSYCLYKSFKADASAFPALPK